MKTTIFKPAPLGSLVLETRILTDGTRFDAMTQDNAGSGAVIAAGFVPSSALADPEDTGRTTVLSDKEIFFHQMYLQMEALIWTPVFAGLTHPGEAAASGQPLELPSVDSARSYGREARRIKTAECEMLVSESWSTRWQDLNEFFNYPPEIRKAIYTTNAIESLNFQLRKVTKNRSSFPNDDAILKIMYLAIKNASVKWTMPIRDWGMALNQFAIYFGDRVPFN